MGRLRLRSTAGQVERSAGDGLSFGIPFAIIPLVIFTSRPAVMDDLVNTRTTVPSSPA